MAEEKELNGYTLTREWFDWCFENPTKARPSHAAVYFWMIELCNRLGWKKEFRLPTLHSMEATGISSKNTYYKAFNDLVKWGFIIEIEKAKNHNSPTIISISSVSKIKSVDNSLERSALDSAIIQQASQREFSGGNIDKPIKPNKLNKPINDIDARKLKFSSTLSPYIDIYGEDLLNDFFKYWTEPNKSKTKFRQELEKTWSLERRLETWAKNDKNFNNKKPTPEKTKEYQTVMDKLKKYG